MPILFLDDFNRYPTAIIDSQTTNKHFLRTSALFKAMGVKNYYFMLALLQPELVGVDPYSPDLTYEQKTAIALECEYNPWYFFREVIRIPNSVTPLRFRCNRGIMAVLWSFLATIDFALIMPRQTGKSVTIDALEVWLLFFKLRNTEILLFTKDSGLRERNIKRIKDTQMLLPEWLNPNCKADLDNTEVVTCVARNNILKTVVGQQQADRAENVGRGLTTPVTHIDEAPWIVNVHISLPVMLSATTAARENAEDNGTLYGNIITTTSGKKDSKEGKFIHNKIFGGMYWDEVLYDCKDKHEAKQMVIQGSSQSTCLINGTFSHRQVGKTDIWLNEQIKLTGGNTDKINRDYYNVWTSGTESSPISTQLAETIKASESDTNYVSVSLDRYMLRWYVDRDNIAERMASGHYILGLDSSNAIGRDANALVLTDIRDMSVVATSTVSEANLHKYANWVADFLIYYPNITLVIENKASAQGIIDAISVKLTSLGIDPFKRMYSRIVDDHKLNVDKYNDINIPISRRVEEIYLRCKSSIGFMTTNNSRSFLYDTVLQDAVKSTGHLIKDRTIINEILSLIVKNGRVDHLPGEHDDSVIAWLLTHWFVKHSKNLPHYGIDPTMCLSLVSTDGALLTDEGLAQRKRLAILNIEINNLKDALLSPANVIESMKYEKILEHKIKLAQIEGDTTLNMDTIMRSINEHKVSRSNLRGSINKLNARRNVGNFPQKRAA